MADDSLFGGLLAGLMSAPQNLYGLLGLGIPQGEIKNAKGDVVFPTNTLERLLQSSDPATKQLAASFVPGPMARFYRGDTSLPGQSPVPDYVRSSPEFQQTQAATGRWFVGDLGTAKYYNQNFGDKSGRVSYVDAPQLARTYSAANQPEAAKFSAAGRAGEEFFLPRDLASLARRLPGR